MKLSSRNRVSFSIVFLSALTSVFVSMPVLSKAAISTMELSSALAPFAITNQFPDKLKDEHNESYSIKYTFDVELHNHIASIYRAYKPDYATFVALDPETGKILSLTSYVKEYEDYAENFALGASYPAASLFKIVSAAAAIDTNLVDDETVIPYNGKSTTLYKSQVLRHKDNKYTRRIPFSEAFAKSSNPIFGRLGIEYLNRDLIFKYAQQMGFGEAIAQDLPVAPSIVDMPLSEDWHRAEASSGFTKHINISPVHAAAIAAAVINDGELLQPYVIDQVTDSSGKIVYSGNKKVAGKMFSENTAQTIKKMMRETTRIGSGRKSFSSHHRYKSFKNAEFGGKTGSLSGLNPEGRYGWFAGYGERNGQKIAYASLVVYKDKWVVRSARVAFEVLNYFFKRTAEETEQNKSS